MLRRLASWAVACSLLTQGTACFRAGSGHTNFPPLALTFEGQCRSIGALQERFRGAFEEYKFQRAREDQSQDTGGKKYWYRTRSVQSPVRSYQVDELVTFVFMIEKRGLMCLYHLGSHTRVAVRGGDDVRVGVQELKALQDRLDDEVLEIHQLIEFLFEENEAAG